MTDPLTAIADRLRASRRPAGGEALSEVVVIPALREAIVSNLLTPGERLTEVTLAARLNVSRTPVREEAADRCRNRSHHRHHRRRRCRRHRRDDRT